MIHALLARFNLEHRTIQHSSPAFYQMLYSGKARNPLVFPSGPSSKNSKLKVNSSRLQDCFFSEKQYREQFRNDFKKNFVIK